MGLHYSFRVGIGFEVSRKALVKAYKKATGKKIEQGEEDYTLSKWLNASCQPVLSSLGDDEDDDYFVGLTDDHLPGCDRRGPGNMKGCVLVEDLLDHQGSLKGLAELLLSHKVKPGKAVIRGCGSIWD